MAKRRTLETTAFGVRVFDTYGIPAKNLILTLRNCGLNTGSGLSPNWRLLAQICSRNRNSLATPMLAELFGCRFSSK